MDANAASSPVSGKTTAATTEMQSNPAPPTSISSPAEEELFPDPDDDDLDDLDDMLDDFSAVKIDAKPSGQPLGHAVTGISNPPDPARNLSAHIEPSTAAMDDGLTDEFAKQLQAGMADLFGELGKSPEMQNELEDMLKRMTAEVASESGSVSASNAGPPHASASPSGASPGGGHADASFQQTIRRTMERMQASGDQATAAAASSDDDFMTEILKNLSAGSLDGEGGEEELSKVLMGMMEQLTNKEILYEPMKELDDKFPDWLEKHKDSLPQEELKKYQLQRELVREMVSKFEESTYSDDNAADREYILDRMQKMQAAGSPPADLVGDMASAQDVFNTADDQCNPQ